MGREVRDVKPGIALLTKPCITPERLSINLKMISTTISPGLEGASNEAGLAEFGLDLDISSVPVFQCLAGVRGWPPCSLAALWRGGQAYQNKSETSE